MGQKIKKWKRKPLTTEELDRLMFAASGNIEQFYTVVFLCKTGCRVNEVLRSREDDFEYDEGYLWIRMKTPEEVVHDPGAKKRKGPKTKTDREVPLDLLLAGVAKAFFSKYDRINRSRQWVYTLIKKLGKDAGIEKQMSVHLLRHSWITNIFKYTDLKTRDIGKIVGHKGGKVVEETYVHSENREIIERIHDQLK